jgi:hypothetical protein
MIQQLDNIAAFNQPIKRYVLMDSKGTTEIVFFPQAPASESGELPRGGQLNYQGPEGQLTFTGGEIYQQRTSLGLLVTVVLEPDLDAGQLNLTLVLPPINLAGKKAQEFETIAIKTRSQGHVIDPGGATLAYRVLMLEGVAQAVLLPSPTALPEPLEPATNNGESQAINVSQPMQKILEITEMNVRVLESFPPQLQVSVFGTVPSTGWSNPQLLPYTYVQAPPDGIYDFDFVATPPRAISAQVISPIRLRTILPGQGVKGIRVHASLNSREVLLDLEHSPYAQAGAI